MWTLLDARSPVGPCLTGPSNPPPSKALLSQPHRCPNESVVSSFLPRATEQASNTRHSGRLPGTHDDPHPCLPGKHASPTPSASHGTPAACLAVSSNPAPTGFFLCVSARRKGCGGGGDIRHRRLQKAPPACRPPPPPPHDPAQSHPIPTRNAPPLPVVSKRPPQQAHLHPQLAFRDRHSLRGSCQLLRLAVNACTRGVQLVGAESLALEGLLPRYPHLRELLVGVGSPECLPAASQRLQQDAELLRGLTSLSFLSKLRRDARWVGMSCVSVSVSVELCGCEGTFGRCAPCEAGARTVPHRSACSCAHAVPFLSGLSSSWEILQKTLQKTLQDQVWQHASFNKHKNQCPCLTAGAATDWQGGKVQATDSTCLLVHDPSHAAPTGCR